MKLIYWCQTKHNAEKLTLKSYKGFKMFLVHISIFYMGVSCYSCACYKGWTMCAILSFHFDTWHCILIRIQSLQKLVCHKFLKVFLLFPGWSGQNCTSYDPCYDKPCLHDSHCEASDAAADVAYRCRCNPPFYGRHCEKANQCLLHPCKNGGQCFNTSGNLICIVWFMI